MEDFLIIMVLAALLATFICFLGFIVKWIMRKPKKRWGIAALVSFALIWVFGFSVFAVSCKGEYIEISRTEPTCTTHGEIIYQCEECGETKSESIEPTGHTLVEISRIEPTVNSEGKAVERCSVCSETITTPLDKPTPPAESQKPEETTVPVEEESESPAQAIDYAEIYREYMANELRADEKYQYNRYQITAKVNGMSTGGLFNLTGGATLTMEIKVENTIVFFYAEFEKEQEETLKSINVGDTITFEGECLSAGSWSECELIP